MTTYAIIPVFNRLEMTKRIVDDLRAQRDAAVRIVVVDDGSSDGTGEWLASQADILALRGSGNLWWAGAVDAALRRVVTCAATHDFVLLLNNDTRINPDFVSTLVRASGEHDGACVGSALRHELPPHRLISIGPRMDVWHMRVWDVIDDVSTEERHAPKRAYEVDALSGRGTLYPIRVLRRTGYLRPRLLPHYHADYELAARARRKGFKTLVSTEAVVYTSDSFGVRRTEDAEWRAAFRKGSPNNPIHRLCLWLMIGTPLQRMTAIPRMLFARFGRSIHFAMPASIRLGLRAFRLAARALTSTEARSRLLIHLSARMLGQSYDASHAYRAAMLVDVRGGDVLVAGSNVGKNCAFFVRLGAAVVHGLGVADQVGTSCERGRLRYLRASAKQIPVQNDTYDLVFCVATMACAEDIERALPEMARVARPGGLVYVASPPCHLAFSGLRDLELLQDGIAPAKKGAIAAGPPDFIARKRAATGTACVS